MTPRPNNVIPFGQPRDYPIGVRFIEPDQRIYGDAPDLYERLRANAADAAPRHSGFAPSPKWVSAIRRVSAFASVALALFCIVYFAWEFAR